MNEQEYIDYFASIAKAHNSIGDDPSSNQRRFALIDEVFEGLKAGIDASTLLMVVKNEEARVQSLGGRNLIERHQCGFWLVRRCRPSDYPAIRQAYSDSLQVGREIIGKMVADKEEQHPLMQYLELAQADMRKEGPVFDGCYGYIFNFGIASKEACQYQYDETRWTWE